VEFVCGLRAVTAARQDFSVLSRGAALLSMPRTEVAEGIERIIAETKAGAKELQKLREELATYHAVRLAVEEQIVDHLRLVKRSFADRDGDYVKLLASRLAASVPQTVALLVSTQQDPALVILARSGDLDFHAGNLMKEALAQIGLRGGGSADLGQGRVPHEQTAALLDAMSEAVRNAVASASETV
jgi:alanyl-tRNA synthetase